MTSDADREMGGIWRTGGGREGWWMKWCKRKRRSKQRKNKLIKRGVSEEKQWGQTWGATPSWLFLPQRHSVLPKEKLTVVLVVCWFPSFLPSTNSGMTEIWYWNKKDAHEIEDKRFWLPGNCRDCCLSQNSRKNKYMPLGVIFIYRSAIFIPELFCQQRGAFHRYIWKLP